MKAFRCCVCRSVPKQTRGNQLTLISTSHSNSCLPACLLCCALSGVERMGVWVVEAAGVLCADEQEADKGGRGGVVSDAGTLPPVCCTQWFAGGQPISESGSSPSGQADGTTGVRIGLNAPVGDFDPFPGGWRLGPIPCFASSRIGLVLLTEGKWCHVLDVLWGLKWCFLFGESGC